MRCGQCIDHLMGLSHGGCSVFNGAFDWFHVSLPPTIFSHRCTFVLHIAACSACVFLVPSKFVHFLTLLIVGLCFGLLLASFVLCP